MPAQILYHVRPSLIPTTCASRSPRAPLEILCKAKSSSKARCSTEALSFRQTYRALKLSRGTEYYALLNTVDNLNLHYQTAVERPLFGGLEPSFSRTGSERKCFFAFAEI